MFACENDVSPDKFLAEDSVFYENDNDLIYADYSIPVQKRFTRRMEYDYDKEYQLYNLQKCIHLLSLYLNK